jgi:hypothetical protein
MGYRESNEFPQVTKLNHRAGVELSPFHHRARLWTVQNTLLGYVRKCK